MISPNDLPTAVTVVAKVNGACTTRRIKQAWIRRSMHPFYSGTENRTVVAFWAEVVHLHTHSRCTQC